MQLAAAKQWGDFWTGTMAGTIGEKPRDRRFLASEWQDDAYYRAIRDAYLLASKQLRDVVSLGEGNAATTAMASSTSITAAGWHRSCSARSTHRKPKAEPSRCAFSDL